METMTARRARKGAAAVALILGALTCGAATGLSQFSLATAILAGAGLACLGVSVTLTDRLLPVALAVLGALIVVAHADGASVYALPFLVAALPAIADAAAVGNRLRGADAVEPRALELAARRTVQSGLIGLLAATVVLAAAALPVANGALAGLAGAAAIAIAAYWVERLARP